MIDWLEVRVRPVPSEVLAEVFGDEAVVVQLRTGAYYSFDAAATARWTAIGSGTTAGALGDGDGAGDVLAFLHYLHGESLVEVDGVLPEPPADAGGLPPAAGIQKFTDMEDLLVLDPIHDIDLDGDGWPTVADDDVVPG